MQQIVTVSVLFCCCDTFPPQSFLPPGWSGNGFWQQQQKQTFVLIWSLLSYFFFTVNKSTSSLRNFSGLGCPEDAASVSLACFGKLAGALAAGRAVSSHQARWDAAKAAGLGDGGPRGEPVGAVRAVRAAPRPRFTVPRQRLRLGAALAAGAWMAGS